MVDSLRDDDYKYTVSDTKDSVPGLKERYQRLDKERHVEAFDSNWKVHIHTLYFYDI